MQLSAGSFAAEMLELHAGAASVRSLSCNRAFQLRRWIERNKLLIAYVNQADLVLEHGRRWSPAPWFFMVTDGELDASCMGSSETTWIEIDLSRLTQAQADALVVYGSRAKSQLLLAEPAVFAALRAYVAAAIRSREPSSAELLRLTQSLIDTAAGSGFEEQRKDAALVRRVERFMWENLEEPLTLQRICENTDCRMRSLIYCFKEWFGLGPIKYLKMLRLNAVRRRLEETRGNARIFDVAADYGFWHMGHFSTDYKRMFGMTASETVSAARANGANSARKMVPALRLAERPAASRASSTERRRRSGASPCYGF
ncbi:MAG TPA: helix-turn-helix domain-containing protein [Candidatus Baltobacteraceae bacterium]|nr:helix-turn-helix domain-containing protein [Candidatus Baltobacteraceae bacterium]